MSFIDYQSILECLLSDRDGIALCVQGQLSFPQGNLLPVGKLFLDCLNGEGYSFRDFCQNRGSLGSDSPGRCSLSRDYLDGCFLDRDCLGEGSLGRDCLCGCSPSEDCLRVDCHRRGSLGRFCFLWRGGTYGEGLLNWLLSLQDDKIGQVLAKHFVKAFLHFLTLLNVEAISAILSCGDLGELTRPAETTAKVEGTLIDVMAGHGVHLDT